MDSQTLAHVQFENFGMPEIVVRLFAFLAQEPRELIAIKKGRQLVQQNLGQDAHLSANEIESELKRMFPDHPHFIPKQEKKKKRKNLSQIDSSTLDGVEKEQKDLSDFYDDNEKHINIRVYMNFFKSFCRLPDDEEQTKEQILSWRPKKHIEKEPTEQPNALSSVREELES